jgi:hypothetical protein
MAFLLTITARLTLQPIKSFIHCVGLGRHFPRLSSDAKFNPSRCNRLQTREKKKAKFFYYILYPGLKQIYTPWPESASELYLSNDCRLSTKLVSNLRIEGATWSARRIPTAVFSDFVTGAATFSS